MRYDISKHARRQMEMRGVSEQAVKKALKHGARRPTTNQYSHFKKQFVYTRKLKGRWVSVVASTVNGIMVVITAWQSAR